MPSFFLLVAQRSWFCRHLFFGIFLCCLVKAALQPVGYEAAVLYGSVVWL
jgi:hypothetical protein